jgi:hypothetical protein
MKMAAVDERIAVHVYLSLDAHQGWHGWAEEQGVSLSSILEVLGKTFAEVQNADGDSDRLLRPVVKAARQIDAQRRRRHRDDDGHEAPAEVSEALLAQITSGSPTERP